MINKINLKKLITDFQRYSNNLLYTNYDESDANFIRFKEFIDENKMINEIVVNKIKDSTIDYNECFFSHDASRDIKIPNNESDHLKAIYDYMNMIEENHIALFNLAGSYSCNSKNVDDVLHNYTKRIFSPLIDYIEIELSKKLMEYDDYHPSITFSGNNSPVFFHSIGDQKVTYEDNDDELYNLVLSKLDMLEKEGVSKEDISNIKKACNDKNKNIVVDILKEVATGTISSLIATGILCSFGL